MDQRCGWDAAWSATSCVPRMTDQPAGIRRTSYSQRLRRHRCSPLFKACRPFLIQQCRSSRDVDDEIKQHCNPAQRQWLQHRLLDHFVSTYLVTCSFCAAVPEVTRNCTRRKAPGTRNVAPGAIAFPDCLYAAPISRIIPVQIIHHQLGGVMHAGTVNRTTSVRSANCSCYCGR